MSEHDARDPFVGINQHIRKEARGQYVPAYAIGKVISTSPLVIWQTAWIWIRKIFWSPHI